MTTTYSTTGLPVSEPALEFVQYFPRQLLTADDMRTADQYFREKLRRHNRMLHGWGVVCGGLVTAGGSGWKVTVAPTYAITPSGDEVCIPAEITFDLTEGAPKLWDACQRPSPCSPAGGATPSTGDTIFLAVCYAECNTRPVRIQPTGCGCDDTACEYSRVRESYELICLDDLPQSHKGAIAADQDWTRIMDAWNAGPDGAPVPIPDCPPATMDSCVVLCAITLPNRPADPITAIDFSVRRVLHR